jgi:hypothetical protein
MFNRKEHSKKYYLENKEKMKEYSKKWYLENKEKMKEYHKKWYLKNKEKIIQNAKKYYLENKEKNKENHKKWYLKNKEKIIQNKKKYYLENKQHIIRRVNKYQIKRRKIDTNFKLITTIRNRTILVLKGKSKCKSTMKLLGCSVEECWKHLESKFQPGMTRENHGKWHLDHVRPCASFDLTKPEEQEKCFHYSNYQPLWAEQNLSKGAKLDYDLE